jgi:hypothetical protein
MGIGGYTQLAHREPASLLQELFNTVLDGMSDVNLAIALRFQGPTGVENPNRPGFSLS